MKDFAQADTTARAGHRPPCVIVGNQLNGLGVARSLAAEGVKVIVAAAKAGPAWWSRGVGRASLRAMTGDALIEDLLILANRLGGCRPTLLFTDEQAMLTVSSQRGSLAETYRFLLPDHQVVFDLLEKSRFQELAGARGFPVPPAATIRGPADLPALEKLRFPCVVKPSRRTPAYERNFAKAYVSANAAEAAALATAMLPITPEIMVQEWIEGEDKDIYFCLIHMAGNRRVDAAFVGRKIRIHPPRTGYTASCTAAPAVHDELTALTERFFAAFDYRGLGSMEYKRDRRDGRYYMVEPTVGRTDWQEEVATLNGVNIPAAAYRHLVGEPPREPAPVSPPRVWCSRFDHVISGLRDDRPATPLPRPAVVMDALWRRKDPLPALLGYPMLLWDQLDRIWRAGLGK